MIMDSHKISACKDCWRKPKKDKDGKCMCECHQDLGQTELREWKKEFNQRFEMSTLIEHGIKSLLITMKPEDSLTDFIRNLLITKEKRHREEIERLINDVINSNELGGDTQISSLKKELRDKYLKN